MTNWYGTTTSGTYGVSANRDGSRLVVGKTHGWTDIYVADFKENGTRLDSPKRLTSSESVNRPSSWTHDSGTVLFSSDRTGPLQSFKQRLDADTAESLVKGPDNQFSPEFSPDAKWILYWSEMRTVSSWPTSERLMRFPASGGFPEQVLELPVDPVIHFSCPSRPLFSCVISRWDQGQLIFYVLDPLEGQGKEIIRTKLGRSDDLEFRISADGSHIAIASDDQLRERLRILDLRNGTERNLQLPQAWSIDGLDWAADGNAIYAGVHLTGYLIARIDLEAKTQILLERKSWVRTPRLSPAGRHLAYQGLTQESNAWLLENF